MGFPYKIGPNCYNFTLVLLVFFKGVSVRKAQNGITENKTRHIQLINLTNVANCRIFRDTLI